MKKIWSFNKKTTRNYYESNLMLDLYLIYQFVRRLATPFEEWEAFELGIIDEKGNVLRKRRELKTREEKAAFGLYDVLLLNIKKLLAKVPGGSSRLASYAAALYLIKEHNMFTKGNELNESVVEENISYEEMEKFITDYVNEDAPANNVGGGAIAGLGVGPDGEAGVSKANQRKHRKRNASGPKKLRDIINKI